MAKAKRERMLDKTGRVSPPKFMLDILDINPGDTILFLLKNNEIVIRKVDNKDVE